MNIGIRMSPVTIRCLFLWMMEIEPLSARVKIRRTLLLWVMALVLLRTHVMETIAATLNYSFAIAEPVSVKEL
jgi:hypothetical protein